MAIAAAVIVAACLLNVRDITGRHRQRALAGLALADVLLQLAVIVVGVFAVLHPDRLTAQLDLFSSPDFVDIVYAAVLAMLAYAGIEAASDLAPDIDVRSRDLKRIVSVGAVAVPLIYAGMAAIALMAVPVVAGPAGPETALGTKFVEEPVLGVVSAFHPSWVADAMRWIVAMVAAPVLFSAATTSMLGVSRHIYTLAINRQIPSWLGKLNGRYATPHVAIAISGVIAIGLVVPTDVKLLAGIYAFGATLAITIAHLSIIRLRVSDPDRDRPFRIPLGMPWRGHELPIPAIVAAVASGLAFVSVLAYHDSARWVGGGWMVFGLLFYVVYRRFFEGTSLTRRVSVSPEALTKQVPEVEFRNILVPVFGTELDDDIVATAGRLAAAEDDEQGLKIPQGFGRRGKERIGASLTVIHVIKVPLTLPQDAELADEDGRRSGSSSGPARSARSTRTSGCRSSTCAAARSARDRRGGPRARGRGDRHRRRAADQDPRRRDLRRDRRGEAGRDRRGDRVRAEEGPLPGPAHGAARSAIEEVEAEGEEDGGGAGRGRGRCRRGTQGRFRRRIAPTRSSIRAMFILIVGCGRVGSTVARKMLSEGHEVSCLDEDPESHARLEVGLEKSWEDSAASSRSAPGWRPTPWSPPGSRRPTPSSPRPTATTPTS